MSVFIGNGFANHDVVFSGSHWGFWTLQRYKSILIVAVAPKTLEIINGGTKKAQRNKRTAWKKEVLLFSILNSVTSSQGDSKWIPSNTERRCLEWHQSVFSKLSVRDNFENRVVEVFDELKKTVVIAWNESEERSTTGDYFFFLSLGKLFLPIICL